MKPTGPRQLLCCAALVAAGALADDPALVAAADAPPLPAWEILEYEQQAFLVTARSRLELSADPDDPLQWRLQANSSVASNAEQVELTLAASDGRALARQRLSQGRDSKRYKTYEFLPQYILRKRFDPPKDSGLPPGEWPLSSRREIPYPRLPAGTAITDAYALLELAGRFLGSDAKTTEVAVNTEFNFYRVKLTRSDGPAIEVQYRLGGSGETVSGRRDTRAVSLQVSPLAEPDKPDFSLLGLYGSITILFDHDGMLPLQLRGTAPRLGSAEINLRGATLRNSGAQLSGPRDPGT